MQCEHDGGYFVYDGTYFCAVCGEQRSPTDDYNYDDFPECDDNAGPFDDNDV